MVSTREDKYEDLNLLQLNSIRQMPGLKTKVNIIQDDDIDRMTTAHTSKHSAKIKMEANMPESKPIKCIDGGKIFYQ
jgi:hypothetical protein